MKEMKVYRLGKKVAYGGEPEPTFRSADRVSSMAYAEPIGKAYYRTKAEAEQALAELKQNAKAKAEEGEEFSKTDPSMAERMKNQEATQEDCQKPYYGDMSDAVHAIRYWNFVKGLEVGESTEDNTVWRLNTLLGGMGEASEKKVKELDEKMDFFGEVRIEWTCMGHTRALWQSSADADWLEKNRPQWKVVSVSDSVVVKKVRDMFVIEGKRIVDGKSETLFFVKSFASKADACHRCASLILDTLGDGDSENGGRGSLKNCYGDIWNFLYNGERYCYADCEFTVR